MSQSVPRRGQGTLRDLDFESLAVSAVHGIRAGLLPGPQLDPFDRMLIAQAMVEGAVLLTVDSIILRYAGPIQKV